MFGMWISAHYLHLAWVSGCSTSKTCAKCSYCSEVRTFCGRCISRLSNTWLAIIGLLHGNNTNSRFQCGVGAGTDNQLIPVLAPELQFWTGSNGVLGLTANWLSVLTLASQQSQIKTDPACPTDSEAWVVPSPRLSSPCLPPPTPTGRALACPSD